MIQHLRFFLYVIKIEIKVWAKYYTHYKENGKVISENADMAVGNTLTWVVQIRQNPGYGRKRSW